MVPRRGPEGDLRGDLPIEDFTGSLALELTDHRFGEPPMTIDEAKDHDANYATPLFVTARFFNRQTGEIKEQQVFLGDFPIMTEKGVFIVNGMRGSWSASWCVPGRLLRPDAGQDLRPRHLLRQDDPGPRAGSSSTPTRGTPSGSGWTASAASTSAPSCGASRHRRDRRGDPGAVRRRRVDPQHPGAGPVTDKDEALLDLYRKLHRRADNGRVGLERCRPCSATRSGTTSPGWGATSSTRSSAGPRTPSTAPPGGAPQRRRHPGPPLPGPSPRRDPDLYTNGTEVPVQTDDIDHFGNRRVRTVGELIQNQVRVGADPTRAGGQGADDDPGPESITPQSLINIRP